MKYCYEVDVVTLCVLFIETFSSSKTELIAAITSATALVIAIAALVYTAKTYYLKRGSKIRGIFGIASHIACDHKYVSFIAIENQKDRALVVFNVYLRLGHNYYVEVDSFEEETLILKPFEVFRRSYDPIDFYSESIQRININNLLNNNKIKKRLILSTSEGKYVVRSYIPTWNPIAVSFKNHLTAIVWPMRSTYRGTAYGGNAKYIIEFLQTDGSNEIVPIYPNDYRVKKFRRFQLTKEALKSAEALNEFLDSKRIEGLIDSAKIAVYEMEIWREKVYGMYSKEVIDAPYFNWFRYYLVGRLITLVEVLRLKKENKKARSAQSKNTIKQKQQFF